MSRHLGRALQQAIDRKHPLVRLVNLNMKDEAVTQAREASETESLAW